ncbi:MAG: hypothetical protein R3F60_27520 [bacterium]
MAEKHGVTYHRIPTLRAAIASHYRFLKRMGTRPEALEGVVALTPPAADLLGRANPARP